MRKDTGEKGMTAPLRWPDKCEQVRMNSISNVRAIRQIIRDLTRLSKDVEFMRKMAEAMEITYQIEIDLNLVGAKAEKERMAQ